MVDSPLSLRQASLWPRWLVWWRAAVFVAGALVLLGSAASSRAQLPSSPTAVPPPTAVHKELLRALQCGADESESFGHCCPSGTVWCRTACVGLLEGDRLPVCRAPAISFAMAAHRPEPPLPGPWILLLQVSFSGQPSGSVPPGSFLEINDAPEPLTRAIVRRALPAGATEAVVRVLSRGYVTAIQTVLAPRHVADTDGLPVVRLEIALSYAPNLEVHLRTPDGRLPPPMALTVESKAGPLSSCATDNGICQLCLPSDAQGPLQLRGLGTAPFAIPLDLGERRRIDLTFDRRPWPWGYVIAGVGTAIAIGVIASSAGCHDNLCTQLSQAIGASIGLADLIIGGYAVVRSARGDATVTLKNRPTQGH